MTVAIFLLSNRCRHLKRIELDQCVQLTALSLKHLSSTKSLEEVIIWNAEAMRTSGLQSCGPSFLRKLVLHCGMLDDRTAAAVAQKFTLLRTFKCPAQLLTDAGMNILLHSGLSLHELDLTPCPLLSDKAFLQSTHGLDTMRSLRLSGRELLTDESVKYIVQNCPMLDTLDISGCTRITDAGLLCLGQGCSSLQSLNCASCPVTCKAMDGISACTLLRVLIADDTRILDYGLSYIGRKCTRLQEFSAKNCSITFNGLRYLVQGCICLETVRAPAAAITAEIEEALPLCRFLSE